MSKPRVLIADDDHAFLVALQARLEQAGFDVYTAEDGYRALVESRQDDPDVLVLDINMPAGNGFTVQERLEHMRSANPVSLRRRPVIYITGDTSTRTATLVKDMGAFALIYKPFEIEELCETIRQAMAPPPCAA